MNSSAIAERLSEKGLRVTPQRIAIMHAIYALNNHPTADNIIAYIKTNHPNIAIGTVYKVLENFVENNLLRKVKTEEGVMRYDQVAHHHHHLYDESTDRIEDYQDDKLDELISDYFRQKGIKDFDIKNIQLHINGTFKK